MFLFAPIEFVAVNDPFEFRTILEEESEICRENTMTDLVQHLSIFFRREMFENVVTFRLERERVNSDVQIERKTFT